MNGSTIANVRDTEQELTRAYCLAIAALEERDDTGGITTALERVVTAIYEVEIAREVAVEKQKQAVEKRRIYHRAYSRAYRETHQEGVRAYQRAYREANREKLNANARARCEADREKRSASNRAYYQAHRGSGVSTMPAPAPATQA